MLLAAGIIDEDKHGIGIVITEVAVGVVPREEMHGLAVMDDLLALPPLEEPAGEIMQSGQLSCRDRFSVSACAGGRTSFRSEKVDFIAGPSAGEVHTQTAVSGVVSVDGSPLANRSGMMR